MACDNFVHQGMSIQRFKPVIFIQKQQTEEQKYRSSQRQRDVNPARRILPHDSLFCWTAQRADPRANLSWKGFGNFKLQLRIAEQNSQRLTRLQIVTAIRARVDMLLNPYRVTCTKL